MCRTAGLLILLAIFPALIAAEDLTCNSTSLANQEWNKNLTKCFTDVFNTKRGEKADEKNKCNDVDEFISNVQSFFTNHSSCKGDLKSPKEISRNDTFVQLLEKADKSLLTGFYEDVECFRGKIPAIEKCQNETSITVNESRAVEQWPARFNLIFDNNTCNVTQDVYNCTLGAISECKGAADLLRVMYNVTLEFCPKAKAGSSCTTASFTLLIPALVLYLKQYLLSDY